MFRFTPGSEGQRIKAIVFTYKSTEQIRDKHIQDENFELAAEAQQQLKELKQSLFEILLSDRYMVDQKEDNSIVISTAR
jgi:beta-lactamase superfamily II metal-dependent hydrolase